MMDKRPLTIQQQRIHDCFCAGMTVKEIHFELKMSEEWIDHERYEIIRKGYDLPKLEIPRRELPADIELTKEIMRNMSENAKRRILSDEERRQIIEEVGAGMSQKECAKKHDLHPTTVCHVIRQYRQTLAEQANPEPVQTVSEPEEVPAPDTAPNSGLSEAATPKVVVNAVRLKLEEVEKCIHLSEQILASAREDRDAMRAWLEVHDAE